MQEHTPAKQQHFAKLHLHTALYNLKGLYKREAAIYAELRALQHCIKTDAEALQQLCLTATQHSYAHFEPGACQYDTRYWECDICCANADDCTNRTPLHKAAASGDSNAIKFDEAKRHQDIL